MDEDRSWDDVDVDLDLGPDDGAPGAGGGARRPPGDRAAGDAAGARASLTRWPGAWPAWARGPAAVLAAVLVAAGAGALAGSAHRDALDRRTALQQALTVGYAFVATGDPRAGLMAAQVHLALVNHSDEGLDVRLQGLTTPHQGTATPPDEVQVGAGGVVTAPLPVRVDCEAVRSDPVSPGAWEGSALVGTQVADAAAAAPAPTVLLASVRPAAGGPAVDVQLPVVDTVASSIDQQLGARCSASAPAGLETGWLWLESGALRVSISALPSAAPVRLELDSTEGLDPTADPPLPRDLLPGETAVVDIRVSPRCDVVGDGALSRLDLRAVDGSGATTSLGQAFSTTPVAGTPQWLARRVALACG